jgi:hypothetical protein
MGNIQTIDPLTQEVLASLLATLPK